MACLSAGVLDDPPGVECDTGLVGVKKPFTRFCVEGVPDGVCGVPAAF